MRIIPAIDIISGKCVRLSKGDYATEKVYNEHPLEVAKMFENHGIKHLHLVDLDGAKASHIVNYKVLETIASKTNLAIDFGGGLKSDEDLKIAFESGANQITGGSIAVKNPEIFKNWLQNYGADKIILGADANNEKVAVGGWLEESDKELIPFIQSYVKEGVSYVICTDISKDGMLCGVNVEFTESIALASNVDTIASGGVKDINDIINCKANGNISGVIVGKAFYEGTLDLEEAFKIL